MQNSKDFTRKSEATAWKETIELKMRLRLEFLSNHCEK